MTTIASKVLSVAQKGFVLGSLSMVGYHCYQITQNVRVGVQHKTMDSTYFEEVQKTVDKEYDTKYGKTDKRDWYDKEDQSFLKDVPRGVKPKTAN